MKAEKSYYSLSAFILFSLFVVFFFPAIIILLSRNILWIEGWILSIWFDAMMLVNMFYMYRKNPALFSERLKSHSNQKNWDRPLLKSLFILSAFWLVGMPLDAQLFSLSPPFPLLIKVIGAVLLIPAFYLIIRATIDNPYLSTVVRMQSDRQQKVISTGVYGLVRHPQYLGILMLIIGSPLLLGSILSIAIGLCIILILIFRIIGEEKMLVNELKGYLDYKQKVKYRLFPFIW